ncbi:MAG: DUF4197 domain-containing protein [Opitutaceae bacterium]|nr:DUF4197 domain-containing protein [Cytophagales bacterium]
MKYFVTVLLIGIHISLFAQKKKKASTTTKLPSSIIKPTQGISGVNPLSESEIANGLRQALSVGAKNAATQLSNVDGFNGNNLIRIPFPPEVSQVSTKLRELGFGAKIDEFETTLNRAAEKAATDAAPIFVNAITQMSITDAKNILTGNNSAATSYLQSKTSDALMTTFSPTIKNALGSSLATSKWTEITSIYNRIPFITPVETDLVKYTTTKALAGLFVVVAQEENKIRENPTARVTDVLQKVFGSVK